MKNNTPETDEGLVRAIGTWAFGTNIVNMVVGAGIFVLPGIVAARIGTGAVLAYLVCAVIVALVFLCYAEAGSRITRSGGSYAYIEEAFGPLPGFVASTLLWLGWSVLSDAAIAVAMVQALAKVIPALHEPWPRGLFLISLFGFLASINILGLKAGMRLFVINTIGKLVPLILLVMVGMFAINFENLVIVHWPNIADLGATALILFFAFGGAETALNTSGEIRNPERTIPRGLLLGISGIFILYVSLQTVAQGTLGPALADNTEAPLVATATSVFGHWGTQLLLIGGVISFFGTLSGDMLNTPRVIFAAARDRLLPAFLAKIHPTHHTPYMAILVYALVGCSFALSGTFQQLAILASGSILLVYLGVCLSVLRLRQLFGPAAVGQFRIPGGALVPILAALVVLWLLSQMAMREVIGLAALLLISILTYAIGAIFRKREPAE